MRRLAGNRKGIYEYVLTKSIMLIFILGLVSIFYHLYTDINVESAGTIAASEADRIAKEIDDVINLKGVTNKATIHLQKGLKVGNKVAPYTFEITEDGVVVIDFTQHPFQDVVGAKAFGINLQRESGKSQVLCTWDQVQRGASFEVTKTNDYTYDPRESVLYQVVTVGIDASESCLDSMQFRAEYVAG